MFNLAVAQPALPRTLTIDGCRILAHQFREARQAKAAGRLQPRPSVRPACAAAGAFRHPAAWPPSHGAGLAVGAVGRDRPTAPGRRAAACNDRAAAAGRSSPPMRRHTRRSLRSARAGRRRASCCGPVSTADACRRRRKKFGARVTFCQSRLLHSEGTVAFAPTPSAHERHRSWR